MNRNSSQEAAVDSPTPQATTTTSSIISDIQQSLNGTNPADPATSQASTSAATKSGQSQTGLVNLNTADQSQLETLPGIGPSKAQAIIDYRTQNGDFVQIDDLTKVKGIGPKTFDSLKSLITVLKRPR